MNLMGRGAMAGTGGSTPEAHEERSGQGETDPIKLGSENGSLRSYAWKVENEREVLVAL